MPFMVSRASCILLITFCLGMATMSMAFHKYYLSTTTIETNRESNSLECTLMFFKDDVERALQEKTNTRVYLKEHKADSVLAPMVEAYILDKFSIVQKEKELDLSYIGYESDEEHIWVYIESVKPIRGEFWVNNTCLMELFDDQKNVINFKTEDEVKSALLLGQRQSASFNMN